ncbi:MAG TPA: sugar phosphate nucleotidyltransferase, partial [bacterium]|nr:sugar phosphate nucleotidyltransferase [bacterium]
MKEMQAVILCGGLGTRLRPLTATIPKALVEVGGRPFLEHQFLELRRHSITRILLLTGYLGGMVEDRFGDGREWGLVLSYSREETPLGTGGALLRAAPGLEETFFLINGDTFLPLDYRRLSRAFSARSGVGLLSVVASAGTGRVPNIRLGEAEKVVDYRRRGPAAEGFTHVDAGVEPRGAQDRVLA